MPPARPQLINGYACCVYPPLLLGRRVPPRREHIAHDVGRRLLGEDLEALEAAVAERVLWQHARHGFADDLLSAPGRIAELPRSATPLPRLRLTSSGRRSRTRVIGTNFSPPMNPECWKYVLSVALLPVRRTPSALDTTT